LASHPDLAEKYQRSSYDTPFKLVGSRDRVLIVGAGAGNDAAAALRNGAREVDAIEIDPVIYSLCKRLHPDHPYDSPRVHVILEDARTYLRRSTQHYDAIVFGLLDSHTQFSGYSNMRVDNYVYTQQSLAEAKRLSIRLAC
jgi:spermidine synthase